MSAEEKGILAPQEKKKKKVAILGFAGSRNEAPFHDESFEIWGLNDLYAFIPRWTRWFQIHDPDQIKGKGVRTYNGDNTANWDNGGDQYKDLIALNCPVYMWKHYEDIPNSVEYPLQHMLEQFGDYFTNSISYMLAQAIVEDFEVIHVYGVDMAIGAEYEYERPSVEYFLGIIKGIIRSHPNEGRELYIPPTSNLLKSAFLYGYEDKKIDAFKKNCQERMQFMLDQQEMVRQAMEKNKEAYYNYNGALEDVKHVLKVWSGM